MPGTLLEDDVIARIVGEFEEAQASRFVRRRNQAAYAMRNVLEALPSAMAVAESPAVVGLARAILGPRARVVKGVLFDKTPDANWHLAWHQDVTIAVHERIDVAGYGPWSVKLGISHVQAPRELLDEMLAIRIHLDDCGADNGPLAVLPASHRQGKLSAQQIESFSRASSPIACLAPRGGLLAMRPLLLHSSSASSRPGHRRVLHLEYSALDLPGGLRWHAATDC